jgi:hypothetical protein
MTIERENRAWHVAGHAYAATMCGIPVHKLSLDGFSESDLADRGDAQRLDEWTMVRLSVCRGLPGGFGHTRFMEALLSIALAGPAVELFHRQLPCVVPNVEQFSDDWTQARSAAERIWPHEGLRRFNLERWVTNSPTVVCSVWSFEFYTRVVSQLLERETMMGNEVQAAWDHMKAVDEASRSRPASRRRRVMDEPEDPEALGPTFLLPPENCA